MTTPTEQLLRQRFRSAATTIEAPPDLQAGALRRARVARTRRRSVQGAMAVGLAAAVAALVVLVPFDLSPRSPGPATGTSTSWSVDLYFLAPDRRDWGWAGDRLVAEMVSVTSSGDKPLDVARALFAATPSGNAVNGFKPFIRLDPEPIADVNAVEVTDDLITVDLDREVWDPYPAIDCDCPSGEAVMQQLVWTLDRALGVDLPVLLTVDGEPAEGIWLHELDGPVSREMNPIPDDVERGGAAP